MDAVHPDPDPAQAAFDEARRAADASLAAGNPGMAAQIYLELLARLPTAHPLAVEARFHRAQLLETAGFRDVAVPIFVDLAREHHDGAWKALDRLLEEAWAAAREAPPGAEGRSARHALRALVDQLSTPTPQTGPARSWLDAAEAEEQIRAADEAYQRGDFARAAAIFEEAGNRAQSRGVAGLARKALGQAAAVYWHRQHDANGTLRTLAAIGPTLFENPALRGIHEKAMAALGDDLRALVRRGDRREAFARLAAAFPLLAPGHPLAEEITDLYLREVASHHITALDNRLIAITRQASQARQELGSDTASTPRTDPADAVAARLRLLALEDEHERLAGLRREMVSRELAVLRAANPEVHAALLASSRESGSLGVLLDRIRRLALERMHYQVKLKSETKDALASLLPEFLSSRLVDRTFALTRKLEAEVGELMAQFLEHAYPKKGTQPVSGSSG